jgi:hypothetical protein
VTAGVTASEMRWANCTQTATSCATHKRAVQRVLFREFDSEVVGRVEVLMCRTRTGCFFDGVARGSLCHRLRRGNDLLDRTDEAMME